MLGTLGAAPLNSAITAGIGDFVSLLQRRASQAYGEDPARYPRAYTSSRGILIDKRYTEQTPLDLNKGHYFQFNPQTLSDVKSTLYETRGYTGLPYNDYIWGGGGERIISFQLFLDNTPQSKYAAFRPQSYGSKLANEIENAGKGYTFDEHGRITDTEVGKRYFGDKLVGSVVSSARTLAADMVATFNPSRGPSSLKFTGQAFSNSRIDERGILPEVEKIQSFLYPYQELNEAAPLFAEGGVVNTGQFRPPTTVVLALGPLYLEGVIKSAPVNYTLFDTDLTPIRGTIDIEFAVFEFENLSRPEDWKAR